MSWGVTWVGVTKLTLWQPIVSRRSMTRAIRPGLTGSPLRPWLMS